MGLFSLFSSKKTESEHYFGLFLKGEQAIGFIFKVSDGAISIIAKKSCTYSNGWENILEDIDELLFKLENETKLHLKQVIYFVYAYFINETTKEVKQPYKDIMKKLSKELELKPMGYIELYEAVSTLIQHRERTPLNAILIELDHTNFGTFIYKGGRKVFEKNMARTSQLVDDMTSVFNKIKDDILLPSRLILYDSDDISKESGSILSHKWDHNTFIQLPRVEIINDQDLYQGLAQIFETQLRQDSGNQPLVETEVEPEPSQEDNGMYEPESEVKAEDQTQALTERKPKETVEVMGFMIGEDIGEASPKLVQAQNIEEAVEISEEEEMEEEEEEIPVSKKPAFSMFSGKKRNILHWLWVPGVVLIVVVAFVMEYTFHKATITVIFPAKSLSKSLDYSVSLSGSTEGAVKTGTVSAQLTDKKATTGKKDVGEKAKGDITVHNFDDKTRTFVKGTTLKSDSLTYVLDQDVTVASASEVLSGGNFVKEPGKTKATVTATAIGTESNIAKGKKLSIADLSTSTAFGYSDSEFSGGTRKSVRTVAKKDMDDLKVALVDKGKAQAISQLKSAAGQDRLLDNLTKVTVASTDFSRELGEEASEVSLKATVAATYFAVNDKDLKDFIATSFQGEVPSGFNLSKENINYTIKDDTLKGDTLNLALDAKVSAAKQVSTTDIQNAITGKKKSNLDEILKTQFNASGYEINSTAPIFFLDSWLPLFKKNVTIEVSSQ